MGRSSPDLFPSVPYASKQTLTTFGLDYWRRPLRISPYAREFLLTVALEGGFPVRILAEGARGWLKEFLRAIMRRAIAWRVDTPDEILAIAEEERGRMRKSYQHDDFIALCSELVTSLLELRQKAEAESRDGIRNSALLDAKYPGWRDDLPIYVPAEDEALVAELLTGLLNEKMTGLTVEGVEVRRYLVKRDGEWRPALLKWIVLDEAHSLVGAAAAEIALLLRRVLLAFSVRLEDVRFVATSATIGSGETVRQQLQRFLADVAGIRDDHVHVIEGGRQMPRRPDGAPVGPSIDIRTADPVLIYDILGRDPATWRLVERLFDGSVPLADFAAPARTYGVDAADLIFAMSRAARKTADNEEERLAPIRLHAFERAVPGIWSCINPDCAQRPSDWPFGRVLPERADECPSCGAPVLEVVSCFECGEAFLEGIEAGPRLSAPLRNPPRDEFAFDSARENDGGAVDADDDGNDAEQQEEPPAWERLFAANPTAAARGFWLDRKAGWRVADGPADDGLALRCEEHRGPLVCPHCSPTGRKGPELIRPLRFGAPFILGNAAPILLEGVEPAKVEAGVKLPSAGRRLLSFTDSRQGTARMAAKLQIESERNFVRSFVYHQAQASMRPQPGADQEAEKLKTEIQTLEAVFAANNVPALESVLAEKRRELARLVSGNTDGIAWPELVNRLAGRIEVSEWIKGVWAGARRRALHRRVQARGIPTASGIRPPAEARELGRDVGHRAAAQPKSRPARRRPSSRRLPAAGQNPRRLANLSRRGADLVRAGERRHRHLLANAALGAVQGETDVARRPRQPDRRGQQTARLAERIFSRPPAFTRCGFPSSRPWAQSR